MQKTDNKNFKESLNSLKGSSKKLFDCLLYILENEDLALGYLSHFETILEQSNKIYKIVIIILCLIILLLFSHFYYIYVK
jgi:hypothetical protein